MSSEGVPGAVDQFGRPIGPWVKPKRADYPGLDAAGVAWRNFLLAHLDEAVEEAKTEKLFEEAGQVSLPIELPERY